MNGTSDDESLISHLEALRLTLLNCMAAMAVLLPFSFFAAPKALDYMLKILSGGNDMVFNFFSPAEVFILRIKTALVIDLVICFPYIAKKLWEFILPALYDNERRFIKSVIFISSILFALGAIFCFFVILPLIVNFGLSFVSDNIKAVLNISNIINLSLHLAVVFGLMFQLPVITCSLIKSGIVDYKTIADKRRYVIIIMLICAAILTPPDIVSQIMLFVPAYILFEAGLLFSKNR